MTPDPGAHAALLGDWCIEAGEGDQVLVGITNQSLPLARAIHNALLERRAWPLMRLAHGELAADFFRHAKDSQLDGFAPIELAEAQAAEGVISINAPANTRALASVDPGLIARAGKARLPVQEARLKTRWCSTVWPTPAAM